MSTATIASQTFSFPRGPKGTLGKDFLPDRGNSECKGPGAGMWVARLRSTFEEQRGGQCAWGRVNKGTVGEMRVGEGVDHIEPQRLWPGLRLWL